MSKWQAVFGSLSGVCHDDAAGRRMGLFPDPQTIAK
jgi:hypothetical protein